MDPHEEFPPPEVRTLETNSQTPVFDETSAYRVGTNSVYGKMPETPKYHPSISQSTITTHEFKPGAAFVAQTMAGKFTVFCDESGYIQVIRMAE